MKLTAEQEAKFTSGINAFGDALAQDGDDRRMHEWFIEIRREMTSEAPPLGHPELRNFLDFCDRVLDRIDARRRSTIKHIAERLNVLLPLPV